MRVKLIVEYDGTDFCGYQTQPGLRTVQSELEAAIGKLTGAPSRVTASGRTDAGVHAVGQVVHFDTDKDLKENFVGGLNYYLPPDVRVKAAEYVGEDFHARFNAKRKTYRYVMYEAKIDSALLRGRAVRVEKLDTGAMFAAAERFLGRHDFAAFRSTGSDTMTTVRTVYKSRIERTGEFIFYTVTADGFLYNMVRKMVAALIEVGKGKKTEDDISSLLLGGTFTPVAPPQGLYLMKVEYDDEH